MAIDHDEERDMSKSFHCISLALLMAGAEGVFIVNGKDGTKIKHIHVGQNPFIRLAGIGG